jgi:error-prone DNA polymerase
MLRPCFSRRDCEEPAEYPTPELEAMLEKTLGVPLLSESAMRGAMVCASLNLRQFGSRAL